MKEFPFAPTRATGLTYVLFIYSFFSLYVIPYESIPFAKLFLPIVMILWGFELIDQKIKVGLVDILLSILVLISSVVPEFSLDRFSDAIIIIILLFKFKSIQTINPLFSRTIYALGSLVLTYHIFFSRYFRDSAIVVINNPDPNFSGFLCLLLFLFFFKNKYWLGVGICLSATFLLWSRNYVLALLVFLLLVFLEKFGSFFYRAVFVRASFLRVFTFFIALNVAVLFFSFYFIDKVQSPVSLGLMRNDPNRLLTFEDDSNWYRFNANKEFFDLLKKDRELMLFGVSGARPDLDDMEYRKLLPNRVPPHNSIYHFVLLRGILFSLAYFAALATIFHRLYTPENLKYIISVLIFGLFLHAIYSGSFLIFFVAILSLPER